MFFFNTILSNPNAAASHLNSKLLSNSTTTFGRAPNLSVSSNLNEFNSSNSQILFN